MFIGHDVPDQLVADAGHLRQVVINLLREDSYLPIGLSGAFPKRSAGDEHEASFAGWSRVLLRGRGGIARFLAAAEAEGDCRAGNWCPGSAVRLLEAKHNSR